MDDFVIKKGINVNKHFTRWSPIAVGCTVSSLAPSSSQHERMQKQHLSLPYDQTL